MRTIRSMLAVAATLVAVLAVSAGVADAGQAFSTDIDVQCDTETGEFVLTLTLENLFAEDGDIEAAYTVFAGSDETASGEMTMTPNPVGDGETSVGVLAVPNTTTFVEIDVAVDYGDGSITDNLSVEIGETCEAVPTTPTTGETTSTTAAAPASQVQPRFTG
jgi:hypothetical protein